MDHFGQAVQDVAQVFPCEVVLRTKELNLPLEELELYDQFKLLHLQGSTKVKSSLNPASTFS